MADSGRLDSCLGGGKADRQAGWCAAAGVPPRRAAPGPLPPRPRLPPPWPPGTSGASTTSTEPCPCCRAGPPAARPRLRRQPPAPAPPCVSEGLDGLAAQGHAALVANLLLTLRAGER